MSTTIPKPLISVIVPVFNEDENIPTLTDRLVTVLDTLGIAWEIIFIDDGSADGTAACLATARSQHPQIAYLRLSRNFGHEAACLAGLDAARGDAVVLMDADLQDPPDLIPKFVDHWRAGAEVVVAQRSKRIGESITKRVAAWVYYRVMSRLVPWPLPKDVGNYRLMDRRVVDAIRTSADHAPVIRALAAWTGFRQEVVRFERGARHAGRSKYSFIKNLSIASWFITGYTTVPLRLGWIASLTVFGIGLVLGIVGVAQALNGSRWETLAILSSIWIVGGLILGHIAVVGEYAARSAREAMARPQYIIHTAEGIPAPTRGANPP